jgi:hypothetical protein
MSLASIWEHPVYILPVGLRQVAGGLTRYHICQILRHVLSAMVKAWMAVLRESVALPPREMVCPVMQMALPDILPVGLQEMLMGPLRRLSFPA